MCLVDMGAVDLVNSAELVGTNEHRERTLASRVLLRLAPWDKILLLRCDIRADDFALVILLDNTENLFQLFREGPDINPALRVVVDGGILGNRARLAHVVNDSPGFYLGYLGPVAFGVHLAQMLGLEAELEGKDFELL